VDERALFRDREYLSRCAVEDVGDHHDGLAVDRVRQHAGRQVDQQREVGDEADDGGLEDRSACREHKEGKGDK